MPEIARYQLASGGKRLRALIPVLLAERLAGEGESALPLGVALELLHNGTLVHDDLQDGDTVRRGLPSVWTAWDPAQAINSGSWLFFRALKLAHEHPKAAVIVPYILDAMIAIVSGQAQEFQLQQPVDASDHIPASLANWHAMADGKTAALFGVAARCGALVANADHDDAASFGRNLGLMFQIQDDLLDLVGNKGRNARATDLCEGKISYPVAWALSEAPAGPDVETIRRVVTTPRAETTDDQVSEGLAALEATGAIAETARAVAEYGRTLSSHPLCDKLPGLVAAVLAPVRHVLP